MASLDSKVRSWLEEQVARDQGYDNADEMRKANPQLLDKEVARRADERIPRSEWAKEEPRPRLENPPAVIDPRKSGVPARIPGRDYRTAMSMPGGSGPEEILPPEDKISYRKPEYAPPGELTMPKGFGEAGKLEYSPEIPASAARGAEESLLSKAGRGLRSSKAGKAALGAAALGAAGYAAYKAAQEPDAYAESWSVPNVESLRGRAVPPSQGTTDIKKPAGAEAAGGSQSSRDAGAPPVGGDIGSVSQAGAEVKPFADTGKDAGLGGGLGAETQAEFDRRYRQTMRTVQSTVGAKPSDKSLRDKQKAFEEASAMLAQRGDIDTSDIDARIAEARQLYKDKENRTEWLELAQVISEGLVRLGAAAEGKRTGVNVLPSLSIPKVDYEKKLDRAQKGYETEVSLAEKEKAHRRAMDQESRLRAQAELAAQERGVRTEEDLYNRQMSAYGAGYDNATRVYSDMERERRALAAEARRGDKDAAASLADTVRLQQQAILAENKEIADEQERLDKSAQSSGQYIAAVLEGDNKLADKLAGSSNITLDEITAAQSKAEKEVDPGWYTDAEEKQRIAERTQALLLENVRAKAAELQGRREANRQALQQLHGGTPAQAQQAPQGQRVIVHKATGKSQPYSEAVWSRIQSSPKANEFELR